jgi:hypothetical protein
MACPTAKVLGIPAGSKTRVSPTDDPRGGYSGSPFNAQEFLSLNSGRLNAIIVAALDRDSELRHDYLLKRWQGIIRKAS